MLMFGFRGLEYCFTCLFCFVRRNVIETPLRGVLLTPVIAYLFNVEEGPKFLFSLPIDRNKTFLITL